MIRILSIFIISYFALPTYSSTIRPCEKMDINKQKQAIKKTIATLKSLKQAEPNLKDINWTGNLPDGCHCKDTVGTDGKSFNEPFYVCTVGAGSGIEITYSPKMAINKIQYFEP